MGLDNPEATAYLFELYTLTKGDTNAQVSMYAVGEALGLEKTDAGAMAEDLFIQGHAELKTLSGGIGITRQGIDVLEIESLPEPLPKALHLGSGPIIDGPGKKALEKTLQDIKNSLTQTRLPYAQMEEMVMDIKTIEIQMLSPSPKTNIIREGLRSLHANFISFGPKDLGNALNSLIIS